MSERLAWDDLPDPDIAATGDGRVIAAAINALTMEVNALRLALPPRRPAPYPLVETHLGDQR